MDTIKNQIDKLTETALAIKAERDQLRSESQARHELLLAASTSNTALRAALVDIADPNCIRTSEAFRRMARAALGDAK